MELLLNLAWLLLALPAYYLWRHSGCVRAGRRISSAQCILALGCMLVVLFPVISATDDLHVMRAEMEESQVSKRTLRQASTERAACSHGHATSFLVTNPASVSCNGEIWNEIQTRRLFPVSVSVTHHPGRAPPTSSLA